MLAHHVFIMSITNTTCTIYIYRTLCMYSILLSTRSQYTLNAENIPDPSCMQGRIQGGVFGVSRPPEIYQRSQNTLKCTISCHFSTLCNKTTYIFQGVAPINNKVIIVD